jgi:hypothetical protein
MNKKLTHALDLYNHGYNVIPIDHSARIPLIKWSEYQHRRSTIEELHQWFAYKDNNLAVVYGQISDAVCVDCDSAEAISYWFLTAVNTPFRIRTRKGMHFIYRYPGEYVASKTKALVDPPIDIKADGGIATTVGTLRDGTFLYHLDKDADIYSPADLPVFQRSWLPQQDTSIVCTPRQMDGDHKMHAERYIAKVPGSLAGERNSQAFRLAAKLKRDFFLDMETIGSLLSEWNLRCDPPMPEQELRAVLRSRSLG